MGTFGVVQPTSLVPRSGSASSVSFTGGRDGSDTVLEEV